MTNESYIKIAIELAKKGQGFVSPGPLQGALFVKNEKIIGAGFYEGNGNLSPEIYALKNAKDRLSGGTLYSNIESDPGNVSVDDFVALLKKNKVSKVVYGTLNPNPEIFGKVVRKIKKAGIETRVGVLEEECRELNKFYFNFLNNNRPYITLKIAMTLDGKIADDSGVSKWITCLDSRCMVHELRSVYDAVLVGRNTVQKDDPELTVRLVEGRNPARIILDPGLNISLKSRLIQKKGGSNYIITSSAIMDAKKKKAENLEKKGVKLLRVPVKSGGQIILKRALTKLAEKNITSILVEGGSRVFSSFVKEKLFDEIMIFLSPKVLGQGINALENIGIKSIRKSLKLKFESVQQIGEDILIILHR